MKLSEVVRVVRAIRRDEGSRCDGLAFAWVVAVLVRLGCGGRVVDRTAGGFFVLDINSRSGHFVGGNTAIWDTVEKIGKDAFGKVGIHF